MYYKKIDLPSEIFVDYFLNDYIPKNNVIERIKNSKLSYVQHHQNEKIDIMMLHLENLLKEKYSILYKIQYFSIFYHNKIQSIHVDGYQHIRHCSLNLALLNYQNTNLIFYDANSNHTHVSDAYYFDKDNVTKVDVLLGEQRWVLVNSGVPHRVELLDYSKPRITLCVRFCGNPTFDTLVKNFIGPA